jgi:glycosyltransferase involved in cell wall biosynthesis
LPAGAKVALFVGLIRPYKGVDVLLDAFARLPRGSDWHLVVAGEPWRGLDAELHRKVTDLALADRVRLHLSWIPDAEMADLLALADVVVLPYRAGSQSAVAPLALSHGIPVISTTVGGLAEVVKHGSNGLLVRPGSVDGLAAVLAGLDAATISSLAAGARASARSLSWTAYAEALEGLLARVVRTSRDG